MSVKCADPSGTGLNAAACSPINGLSQEISIDTGGYEGPVALPVTIAKEVEGLDASSFYFVEGRSLTRTASQAGSRASATQVGTLYFQAAEYYYETAGACPAVWEVVAGEFFGDALTASLSTDCLYAAAVYDDQLDDVPISFLVQGPGSNQYSAPTIVIVNSPTDLLDDYTISVIITFSSSTGNDADYAYDIEDKNFALMDVTYTRTGEIADRSSKRTVTKESVIFLTEDADGNSPVYTQPRNGNFASSIFTTYSVEVLGLQSAPGNVVFTIDENCFFTSLSESGAFLPFDAIDEALCDDAADVPDFIPFRSDRTNTYQAFVQLDEVSGQPIVVLYSSETQVSYELLIGFPDGISDIKGFDLTQNILFLTVVENDGQTGLFSFDFTEQVMTGTSPIDISQTLYESDSPFIGPPIVNDDADMVYFLCDEWTLCALNLATETTEELFTTPDKLSPNYTLSTDYRTYIMGEEESDPAKIWIYVIETDTFAYLHYGSRPVPSQNHITKYAYLAELNGTTQMASGNLRSISAVDIPELTITAQHDSMCQTCTQTFIAEGGMSPYAYSVTSGSGQIDMTTGWYEAGDAGSVTIQVTDAEENTADATIEVFASGAFNTDFSTDGLFDLDSISGTVRKLAYQTDGKIVAVGSSADGDFIVTRVSAETGLFDEEFDDDGVLQLPVGDGGNAQANDVEIQPDDGKIVVCGWAEDGGVQEMAFARFNTDGSVDTDFGGDGIVIIDINDSGEVNDVEGITDCAIGPDNRIYAAGYSAWGVSHQKDTALVVLNTNDGSLDTDFASDGYKLYNLGGGAVSDFANAIAVQGDEMILLAGIIQSPDQETVVLRVSPVDGGQDASFGVAGIVKTNVGGNEGCRDLVVSTSNIMVVGVAANTGTGLQEISVVSLSMTNGDGDPNFGTDGVLTLASNDGQDIIAHAVAEDSDGRLLIAGNVGTDPNTDWVLVRVDPDTGGDLDTDFGDDGYVTYDSGATDYLYDVAISTGGMIYVGGVTDSAGTPVFSIGSFWP